MKTVLSIVQALEATPGRNDKKALLEEHKENQNLERFFRLSFDPYTSFYESELPVNDVEVGSVDETQIFWLLDQIKPSMERSKIKDILLRISSHVGNDEAYRNLLARVLKKDPSCGVGEKTSLAVWPNQFPTFDVMKAEEAVKLNGVRFPAYVEDKIDGARTVLFKQKGKITLHSSSGRAYPNMESIKQNPVLSRLEDGWVLDGELVQVGEAGKHIKRETSNGNANKALNGNLEAEEEAKFVFFVFDILPIEDFKAGAWHKGLMTRKTKLASMLPEEGNIVMLPCVLIHDVSNVDIFMKQAVKEGKEGVMVKGMDSIYEAKRSDQWVKLKKEFEADFEIVGLTLHSKKKDQIGSIQYQSSDGLIQFSAGSKLTDSQRKELFRLGEAACVGKISTIRFHDLTTKEGEYSIYLPRVIELFREDKKEADSFDKVKYITNFKP